MTLCALKSGNARFHCQEANLREIVGQAVCEVTDRAAEADVTIEQEVSETLGAVVDREHLKTVIVTMLQNAVRFSPSGGQVVIRAVCQDAEVVITVTDRGPGIDADLLPHVFDDFTDADSTHHADGQGLSLAIARQIVLRHNGRISAQSTKEKGTTFTVRLPLRAAEADSSSSPPATSTAPNPTALLPACSTTAAAESPAVEHSDPGHCI